MLSNGFQLGTLGTLAYSIQPVFTGPELAIVCLAIGLSMAIPAIRLLKALNKKYG